MTPQETFDRVLAATSNADVAMSARKRSEQALAVKQARAQLGPWANDPQAKHIYRDHDRHGALV